MFRSIVFKTTVSSVFFSALFAILFSAGCSLPHQEVSEHAHGGAGDDHGDDHGHGDTNESVSLWTDELELFTEFPLLVTGEPQRFLLHLTHVQTGLPVRDVPVTFSASPHDSGTPITGEATPVRPGIYTIEPVFPKGGEWSLTLEVQSGDTRAAITMKDLDIHGEDELHEHGHGEEDNRPNLISFLKEQQWLVPTITVSADQGSIIERHRVPASVLSTPDVKNTASAVISGVALAHEGVPFPKVGDRVEAGQILVELSTDSMTAESLARDANLQGVQSLRTELDARAITAAGEAARARALVGQHETALGRAEALLEAGAGSQREVDALRGTLAEARATLSAAERIAQQAQQALTGTATPEVGAGKPRIEVAAPISGIITRVFVGSGTLIAGGAPLFEIVNTAQVTIEARVPESLATTIKMPLSGMFEVPGKPGDLHEIIVPEGVPQPMLLPNVDEKTRTIPALFHAENPEELLRADMSLSVWIDVRQVENAMRVPEAAVVDENGMPTVYVMLEGETFQKRNVRLGISDGMYVEVLDGIQAGERVATTGAYAVRLAGLADSSLGSAHVH